MQVNSREEETTHAPTTTTTHTHKRTTTGTTINMEYYINCSFRWLCSIRRLHVHHIAEAIELQSVVVCVTGPRTEG